MGESAIAADLVRGAGASRLHREPTVRRALGNEQVEGRFAAWVVDATAVGHEFQNEKHVEERSGRPPTEQDG